ncbi:MAG: hypothetical protein CM15mP103_01200 [Gammaproteobacteria bacterium]|nr:MAG: hypothetical protein CM15mP103_01200 [Gammaproteobacteria bacterium]
MADREPLYRALADVIISAGGVTRAKWLVRLRRYCVSADWYPTTMVNN